MSPQLFRGDVRGFEAVEPRESSRSYWSKPTLGRTMAMLDFNRDGRVCRDDGAMLTEKVLNILQHNLPSAGGFVAGFMGGINFG